MSKLDSFWNSLNWLIRKNARHNLSFRSLLSLSKSIEELFNKYRLKQDNNFENVFKNIGQIRIDATEISYLSGQAIEISRQIEGKDLSPLATELHNSLEDLKRSLFTRTLSKEVLTQRISQVDMAFHNFLIAISDIQYK